MSRQTVLYLRMLLQPILFILCLFISMPVLANHWRELKNGIEYIDIASNPLTPWSHVHGFRIDLQSHQFELVLAKFLSQQQASVDEFAKQTNALITINGGFFDKEYKPLGLRVSHQEQYSPLKHISWWGVFYIKNQIPHISSLSHFNNHHDIDFAVQSGPRLLIKGRVPSLKNGYAERSALGITKDNKVIILVTENTPMTTTKLAELMQSPPLNCHAAINLDGGGSSQLNARVNLFKIHVQGFSKVSDAIVVKTKS